MISNIKGSGWIRPLLRLACVWGPLVALRIQAADPTVARLWNESLLDAIRIDVPNPPVHARNLFSLSVAMYDAWAAYDPVATGYVYTNKHTAPDVPAARRAAISQAAYRLLGSRFANSLRGTNTLPALDRRMQELGYPLDTTIDDPSIPLGLGNRVFQQVNAFFLSDGSRQAERYADRPPSEGGYLSANGFSLLIGVPGSLASDISRWQPMAITDAVTQNGIPVDSIQKFIGSHWREVRPFALTRETPNSVWIDPGPPPRFGESTDAYVSNVVAVLRASQELGIGDGVRIDISPGARGNNPIGSNSGTGHPVNPFTGQPYPPNVVLRGDFTRILAEYWADGPHSETPPGHWNVIANEMRDHPAFRARLGGTGPELDPLEWDVKMYLALNGAVHDAACAAWTLKREYDGWRPISAIRFMGMVGQRSDPTDKATFSELGLPLIPGLIERTTTDSVAPGGRHAGLPPAKIVALTWPEPTTNRPTAAIPVRWGPADFWWPYQARNFVTPAFPGYVSGHSTFSRAAAEVLAAMTGTPFYPGGVHSEVFGQNAFLRTDVGPSETVTLQWATYYDAADMAGQSRIWGGIHPPADDFPGRIVGAQAGRRAWAKALTLFGTGDRQSVAVHTGIEKQAQVLHFRVESVPGAYYRLERSEALDSEFETISQEALAGPGNELTFTHPVQSTAGFFRVVRVSAP